MEQLRDCCDRLVQGGVIDRVIDIDYSENSRHRVDRQHFGSPLCPNHTYKGYPILGTNFSLEKPKSDYLFHFDSDMFLHSQPA
jgi:hypothetical protein